MDPLPLTGERTAPGIPSENYWFRRHEAAYESVRRLVRGRVLDLGAGEGYGSVMLRQAAATVVSMELDEASALHAARRYGCVVVRGDACALPFRDGVFDAVVAMQVVEHLWCPERFVAVARAALAAGGTFVVSTPNRDTFSPGGVRNPFHTHEYTAGELAALLGSAFDHVEVRGLRHGIYLRSLDVLGEGSLQHRLMERSFQELDSKLRTGIGLVRARHFTIGEPEGSLDLLAVAR
ncbi:MAG: class I SAM-dependent methyltransferase [Actinomycetota bacterium]